MQQYRIGDFMVTEYEELASTNTTAAALPRVEQKDKSVILTYHQTQGRGQVGNTWESEPQKNISMTIIFRPCQLEAGKQFAISMVIALGCCDFIGRYADNCCIKWPNDIYVGDKKIAGILIEHSILGAYVDTSICGIGLNINQNEFHSNAPNPVSLVQLLGKEIPLSLALKQLLEDINKRYRQIATYETLEADYLKTMYRIHGSYEWEDEQSRFIASIAGVDEYGRLLLKTTKGEIREYGFKEIKFVLP